METNVVMTWLRGVDLTQVAIWYVLGILALALIIEFLTRDIGE